MNNPDNMLKEITALINRRVNKCRNLESPVSDKDDIIHDILLKIYQNPEYAYMVNNNKNFDEMCMIVNTITSRHLSELFKESYTYKNK